jgi:DNA-binding MarR family transcriptional regulator
MPRVEGSECDPEVAPVRSVRRATARRAHTRRASARLRQRDTNASIVEFLAHRPGSTAGDLAKGLSLERDDVATRLAQLAQAGEIYKGSHGYRTD